MSDYDRLLQPIRRIPINSGLLLLNTSSNTLWAYNDSAREVWDLIERGHSGDALAAEFALRYGIPDGTARADVEVILRIWKAHGLLGDRGGPMLRPVTAEGRTDWMRLPPPAWAASLTCTISQKVFSISVERPRTAEFVTVLYRHLATPRAQPDLRLEVREAEDGAMALLVDGAERLRTTEETFILGALHQTVLEAIYPGVDWLAMIHGGAVARNGAALAISAASGRGKTTLIAYLLPHGYDYLADDLIALSATHGSIVPWPLPLSIKEGSWDLLSGLYPDMSSFPTFRTRRGASRQIVPDRTVWDIGPVPPRGLIFPHYIAGAEANLTRLAPIETIERLLGDQIWLGYPITEQGVRAFVAWLEKTPAYSLVHGNVADAARLIEEIA